MMAHPKAVSASRPAVRGACLWLAGLLTAPALLAQNLPISAGQRATAQQVAEAGVPLSELAPNAPDSHTVKRGDTLWGISKIFLKSPWRWPELWGMNMDEVRNPHRIYPGQVLVLDKSGGRARLRIGQGGGDDTVKVSPRTRIESLTDQSIPTLQPHLIEPFLAEPLIVDAGVLEAAPRIVAVPENKVLVTRGDRVYARGPAEAPLQDKAGDRGNDYRVFRNAKPLVDPINKAVLGYEAYYVGKAQLARGESSQEMKTASGDAVTTPVPATIDIVLAKEEMRVGDRLLPEPPRQLLRYTPRAPETKVDGAVVSVYGNAVAIVGQNQVVAINKGTVDGIDVGHVLAILKTGKRTEDRTDGQHTTIKLPDERNGLLMVFRPFEKVSYALVLEITDGVVVGDRVVNPR